ncbi:spore coat protein [Brevibacillus humidisoli]|uniref:spore coat protein n=1 Tax=Brevibacillus humidisoli TaxID=2895522 RepID=UPI001E3724B0|nr:spore coat protein [Brevibacillus humidisoli]UFJ39223.1 spore coat protein [Brevibacillus humidisoli]
MQHHQYGAHEVIELHEVLAASVDALNLFRVYLSYVQDPELEQIVSHQLSFMTDEYNSLIHLIHGRGMPAASSYKKVAAPGQQAGMQGGEQVERPNRAFELIDDRDVVSTLLGTHKAGAKLRMDAALECADAQIRSALLQAANNCAMQAFETWGYMNRRGFYELSTLQPTASAHVLGRYQPTTERSAADASRFQPTEQVQAPPGPVYPTMPSAPSSSTAREDVAGSHAGGERTSPVSGLGFPYLSGAVDHQTKMQQTDEESEGPASRH